MEKQRIDHSPKRTRTLYYLVTFMIKLVILTSSTSRYPSFYFSSRTLPLAGVTEPSDASPIFSRLVLAAAPPVVPAAMDDASRSGALLDADQNGTRDDNVRVMNDGHRSDLPSCVLRAPSRSRRPVRRRLSSPAAATISLRTSSGSRSVNSALVLRRRSAHPLGALRAQPSGFFHASLPLLAVLSSPARPHSSLHSPLSLCSAPWPELQRRPLPALASPMAERPCLLCSPRSSLLPHLWPSSDSSSHARRRSSLRLAFSSPKAASSAGLAFARTSVVPVHGLPCALLCSHLKTSIPVIAGRGAGRQCHGGGRSRRLAGGRSRTS
jgi:hypothetical protein